MAELWMPLAAMSVVAMAFVLVPFWRLRLRENVGKHENTPTLRSVRNREIFQQRQFELQREVAEGTIAGDDYDRMLAELQRSFLADMQALQQGEQVVAGQRKGLWVPLVLALAIPVLAVLLYRAEGAGPDLGLPDLLQQVGAAEDETSQNAALNELTEFLEQRLSRRPGDMQNGYMLGTLYLGIERYSDAITVFEKMLESMEPTTDKAVVLGQLAQARFLLADQQITSDVQATMDAALELNPNEQAVMALYAIDAFMQQDFASALQYWRRQLSDLTPGSQEAEQLRQRIALVEANLPVEQQITSQGSTISVTIDVSPALAAQVQSGMRLFVFARSPAMPMPIVAQNLEVTAFPITLSLDNSMSMTGMQLESTPELVVGARLSTSGNAIAQSGDLQTLSMPFKLAEQTEPLSLTIDSIVP